jgi:hypothetical protein
MLQIFRKIFEIIEEQTLHGYQLEPVEGTSGKVSKLKIIKKKNWHFDNTYNVFNYNDFSYNDNTYYTQKGNIACNDIT